MGTFVAVGLLLLLCVVIGGAAWPFLFIAAVIGVVWWTSHEDRKDQQHPNN